MPKNHLPKIFFPHIRFRLVAASASEGEWLNDGPVQSAQHWEKGQRQVHLLCLRWPGGHKTKRGHVRTDTQEVG